MLKYNFYIKEKVEEKNKVDFYLSKNFIDILFKMNIHYVKNNIKKNEILSDFLNIIENAETGLCVGNYDVSFVDVTDKNDTISYITSNKAYQILDKFKTINRIQDGLNACWFNNRQEQKLSRFITRIFGKNYTQSQIEDFVNEYKAKFSNIFEKFEIVQGNDVKKYYSVEYYSDGNGHLQKSCMRYNNISKYFNIYSDNPDKMKMLILKEGDLICGRANLWYLDEPSGRIFMDRVYTTHEWQVKLFIDYAIKNDYIFKSRQIYGGDVIPLINKGKKEKITLKVNLKPKDYEYYPYVDTLQFYSPVSGEMTSDVKKFNNPDYLTLVMFDGHFYRGQREYKIDYLGRIVHEHFLRWSKLDKVFIHVNDVIVLNYRNDYVTPEHDFIKIKNNIYLKDDLEFDKETSEYSLKKNFNI